MMLGKVRTSADKPHAERKASAIERPFILYDALEICKILEVLNEKNKFDIIVFSDYDINGTIF